MKLLYILNVANRVNSFSYSSMCAAQELGFEFHIAGNWGYSSDEERKSDEEKYGIKIHQIDLERFPISFKNKKAYKQLLELMQREKYDIVHSNTPIGGILGRICAKKCKVKNSLYQVHGFHFYKGAPLLNWLIYYPVEKLCAHWTDVLITINYEDYALAQKKMKAKRIEYVPGVGIDLQKYDNSFSVDEKQLLKKELNIPEEAKVLLSVGEINQNKNHRTVIEALSKISQKDVYYVICGQGPLVDEHKELAKTLGIDNRVIFTGYRTDVPRFFAMADVFVFPSFREGLSVALMEAMASGLPVACSRIRGNTDLIDENGGALFDPHSVDDCAKAISDLIADDTNKKSEYNLNKIQQFSLSTVMAKMKGIYQSVSEE